LKGASMILKKVNKVPLYIKKIIITGIKNHSCLGSNLAPGSNEGKREVRLEFFVVGFALSFV